MIRSAVARIIEQFRRKPRYEGLLRAWLRPWQDIRDQTERLRTLRWIDTAEGAQLDGLGRIVGISRGGRDDDAYRLRLRTQILINAGNATSPDISRIMRTALPEQELLRISDYPAAFRIRALRPLVEDLREAARVLGTSKPGGVRAIFEYHKQEPVFSFGDGTPGDTGFGAGFWAGARRARS